MPVKVTNTRTLITVFALCCFFSPRALAADLTPETIKAKVLAAKIFNEEREITAEFDNPVIKIAISSPFAESEKDKKINAVLIAKSVFPLSRDAMRVRVRFFPENQNLRYDQITVSIADVKYFADGKETPDALIKSIDIEPGTLAGSNPSPSPSTPLTRLQTKLNIRPNLITRPALPEMPLRFVQDLQNKSNTNALYGRLLSAAKGFRVLELAGVDTLADHQRLVRLISDVSRGDPDVVRDVSILMNILREKGFDRFNPPAPLPGAVDRVHWQDTIGTLSTTIRNRLGSDTPDLDGLNLGERVRVATLIHALGERGLDVTAWRRRLLQLDEHCQKNTDPNQIREDVKTLENEMGF